MQAVSLNQGCFLNDVLTSNVPFTAHPAGIFQGAPASQPQGYTHADVLWYTRPEARTYTYDNMSAQAPAASATTATPTAAHQQPHHQHGARRLYSRHALA